LERRPAAGALSIYIHGITYEQRGAQEINHPACRYKYTLNLAALINSGTEGVERTCKGLVSNSNIEE
jgi:hypothetical protein